jgi:GNAT superfamily N-acetyltransferase
MRTDTMSAQLIVRPARSDDFQPWLMLWRGYCASLDGTVPDTITEGVWRRILAPDEAIWCLLACQEKSEPVGLANYVLHPHTWSLQTICYLEDLFVLPAARGSGTGQALIEALVALGRKPPSGHFNAKGRAFRCGTSVACDSTHRRHRERVHGGT